MEMMSDGGAHFNGKCPTSAADPSWLKPQVLFCTLRDFLEFMAFISLKSTFYLTMYFYKFVIKLKLPFYLV